MRIRTVQRTLPAVVAVLALLACDIPDDGYAELKGTIIIPAEHLDLVVQPADAESDCDAEAPTWGDTPALGDVLPTIYIGLYRRPFNPLEDNLYNPDAEPDSQSFDAWRQGCGEIDHDGDPTTPALVRTGACPLGGTTATYVQTVSGTNGGAVFEFEALQLPKGTAYLFAWLDNKCRDDNQDSNNLVWDISGPPGPLDETGAGPSDDPPADPDEFDLTLPTAIEVDIGSGGNSFDEPLVLSSALSADSTF